jgi:hypothetical protein
MQTDEGVLPPAQLRFGRKDNGQQRKDLASSALAHWPALFFFF